MKRSDAALRAQAPLEVLALLTAYEDAAKREITLDHQRARALSEIARRGFTGDDIVMVVRYVRRLAKLPKTAGPDGKTIGFSDASVGFQNLLLDVNKFEDRILEAREAILAKAWRARGQKPMVLLTQECGGGVRTLVEKEVTPEQKTMQDATRAALLDLAKGIGQ